MKKLRTALILIAAPAILVGGFLIFVYSGWFNVAATAEHTAAEEWLLQTVKQYSVERRAAEIEVPDLAGREMLVRGAGSYQAMCATCHGAPGVERSAMGAGLNPLPPTPEEMVRRWSPAELFWVTNHGIRMTGMPAWGDTHTDEELWEIVAFLVQVEEISPEQYGALAAEAPDHVHDHVHE